MMFALLAALAVQTAAPPAKTWPTREGDVVLKDFRFADGESLPQLKIHYTTLGQPHRNAAGQIDNAVMVLHGTGGDGHQFLRPQFADELYGPGEPLDIRKYYIILPDNIGHGKSSKPSDGLRMKFPKFDYADMIEAQHRMLTEGLGIRHMRLIMGTSMGCMHSFMWGEMYPDFASALMPLACEPIEIAGLNRMWRQMLIDGIEKDPAWNGGNYSKEPEQGLRTAASILVIAGGAPLYLQKTYPTREAAKANAEQSVDRYIGEMDANDTIYQFDSSRNYNPWPNLEKITAPMMWVNSADDFINPRNLPIPQQAVKRMKNARFRLIPESSETHGHGTHTWAKFWKADLSALLARTAK
jgi:homoserine O-acetyltransferase